MSIEVVCDDGEVRHRPFDTERDAVNWAWWGHVCLARHTYRTVKEDER